MEESFYSLFKNLNLENIKEKVEVVNGERKLKINLEQLNKTLVKPKKKELNLEYKSAGIKELIGRTIKDIKIEKNSSFWEKDCAYINLGDGTIYKMFNKDCCGSIIKVEGDKENIIGIKIIATKKIREYYEYEDEDEECYETTTETHYKITTDKGTFIITWSASGNGYSDEDIEFAEIEKIILD